MKMVSTILWFQFDIKALIDSALAFVIDDMDRAYLGGVVYMRTAIRLEVKVYDLNRTHFLYVRGE